MSKQPPKNSREKTKNLLLKLQDNICKGLENTDGKSKFTEESWLREEGGGGRSRVLKNGSIFEQAGVNFSEVYGNQLPQSIVVVTPGTGFAVGDTITFPVGLNNEADNAPLGGNSSIVYTVGANDIFENTTQGSTDFELHPSEEPQLITQILLLAGLTMKDRTIVSLSQQVIQANAVAKRQ